MENKIPETLEELPIKFFKLMNGDSIISYTHNLEDDHFIGLEEPMTVSTNTNHEYILTPWMPFSKGHVHILDNLNIILDSPVNSNMKAYYMKLVLDNISDVDDVTMSTDIPPSTILH